MEYISSYHDKITGIISDIDEELNYAKLNTANLFGVNFAKVKGNHSVFCLKTSLKRLLWLWMLCQLFGRHLL